MTRSIHKLAAAPDMLAALKALLAAAESGWPDGYDTVADTARAAIAKAEGTS